MTRQRVVSVVPAGGSLFEIATPVGIWGPDRARNANLEIDFVACGLESSTVQIEGGMSLGGLELLATHIGRADVVVVPTWPVSLGPPPDKLVDMLSAAHAGGATIVGLCLGAFAVAPTGLLDGKGAVTHWRYREQFEHSFPDVRFEPDTLYVDNDTVVTSAGSAAAVDCCLHLVRRDHGAEAAATIARSMVTAPHRAGAQSQFASAPPIEVTDDPVSQALALASERIADIGSVDDLAELTKESRRSLERHMQALLGVTPKAWIDEQRIITACRLLETTDHSIDRVATEAGYGSTPTLRRAFQTWRGTTPTAYRTMFVPNAGT